VPEVKVHGVAELRASLAGAVKELGDMSATNAKVGELIAAAAVARAPKRSGRLAASGRATGAPARASVAFGSASVPYANVIHWGWPRHHIAADTFAVDAALATEAGWTALITDRTQEILDTVRGA
jgi:hypothetical protein